MKRTLNVVKTDIRFVYKKWGISGFITVLDILKYSSCFIRCDKNGKVNWDKAPMYSEKEIIDRKICIRNLKNP